MRRGFIILAFVIVGVLALGVLAAASAEHWLGSAMRAAVVAKLEKRFQSKVELEDLQISLFPIIRIAASNLQLHYRGRTDIPPLISMKKLTAHLSPWDLLRKPVRIGSVHMEELKILIPPKRGKPDEGQKDRANKRRESHLRSINPRDRYPFFVEEIHADGAVLMTIPEKADNEPLVWEINRLKLKSVGMDRPMNFVAELKNAKPPGAINSSGQFGPWREDDPGQTFVAGNYTFKDADLSVFNGIAGRLSSEGSYQGVLERIQVSGSTDTPDFRVVTSGNPVHLRTEFNSVVDGTSGDTLLDPVKASIGRSRLVARGGVTKVSGIAGKVVKLRVSVSEGHIEDLLRLAVKSQPPFLIGGIRFDTNFLLPPGEQEIPVRLRLDGNFDIRSGRFTNAGVREKLEEFSWRARGRPKDEEEKRDRVMSNMAGRFLLKNGVMTLSNLSFGIPGALVKLDGTYGLPTEQLDFYGTLRMQAKVSQTVSGVKSIMLKVVDPFFTKPGAGTVLPIKISGKRDNPQYGLNFGGNKGKGVR
ncbi:MAG TPA: AsmA-like C-terminal region-containing protein [Acidobacteriota bacterium]|jgi:hypothetical protein|nr:AsmA-like C-terminal region-containing protein [Acidobacteriota bacterium]